jgi:EAL domain-containing protein (putative c-di-GMP-specific phosphodiesterase class I)
LEHRSSQDETELSALRIQLSAGEVLFREGDLPTTAFLIEAGELEISMLQHGKRVVLSRLSAGDLLGEMAVIDDAARTATAIAATDCILFPIDREQITERLAATDPIIRSLLEGQLKRYRGALAAMQGKQQDRVDNGDTPTEQLGIGKIRLETHLREALANDGLDVRYQPLLHVASSKIAGYEALVRWNHPERGPISPVEFVALAEETSLIVPVGEYVFDTACKAVQRFIESGAEPKPFVAVNVSARQLGHPGLIDRIVARVDAAGVPRGSLKVEITESQALNYELVAGVIDLCHRHGIKVALDDFGTGYSHLTHLHRLPFDTLKVDQAFTHSMLTDPRSMAIVEAIIRMGKAIGADIVVEGIETPELLEALRSLDCDYAQGYLIGKPQTLDELIGHA